MMVYGNIREQLIDFWRSETGLSPTSEGSPIRAQHSIFPSHLNNLHDLLAKVTFT